MSIALVTDSNAQLSPVLSRRLGATVVPITVTIDGVDHLEGVDLEVADAYRALARPDVEVATAAPSPGRLIDVYQSLAAGGADEILSVHVSREMSATVNNARLAARAVEVEVEVVDTGLASFGIGCCVWEAADALRAGAGLVEAADAARATAGTIGSVFIVQAVELARRGGRYGDRLDEPRTGIPVLSFIRSELEVIATVDDAVEAAETMARFAREWGTDLRVAIAMADPATEPIRMALEAQLCGADQIDEIVHYTVGPSVAAHTGADTAGLFVYERIRR
ncbi:MAG: DegV family protein [Acidimicrobiales bacterium]